VAKNLFSPKNTFKLKTHLSIQNGSKTQNQIEKDFSLAALICFSRQG
jgi:hypothetical protein